jgi:hypothetical protein
VLLELKKCDISKKLHLNIMLDALELESLIIVAVCGAAIGAYCLIDPNKDMERHLHQHERCKYYVCILAVAVLSLGLTFHARHIVMAIAKAGWRRFWK